MIVWVDVNMVKIGRSVNVSNILFVFVRFLWVRRNVEVFEKIYRCDC